MSLSNPTNRQNAKTDGYHITPKETTDTGRVRHESEHPDDGPGAWIEADHGIAVHTEL